MRVQTIRRLGLGVIALTFAGCANLPRPVGPHGTMITPSQLTEPSRCRVAANQATPLITEWPASEKANLEALLKRGGVAVSYTGCSMQLLTHCALPGTYHWQRTSPASDYLEINDEDELYAKLPLGAASLQGELKRWGKLSMETRVSGQLRLEGLQPSDIPEAGDCARATHVIGSLSVGAFTLSSGGGYTAGASADVGVGESAVVQAGGKMTRGAGLVRSAGETQACSESTEGAPHPNCRSPIQAFLWSIPGRAEHLEGPAGTVRVDIVSGSADSRWDVYVDDEVICSTPCQRWLNPSRPIYLRARDNGMIGAPDRIRLAGLGPQAYGGAVQLQAHPTSQGKFVTGITFTSLGGMGVMTGGMLALLGCRDEERAGLCSGGLITAGAGALVAAGSVWLILDSFPKAEVVPLYQLNPGGGTVVTTTVGPGFVSGTF